jgi:hypothetical protein
MMGAARGAAGSQYVLILLLGLIGGRPHMAHAQDPVRIRETVETISRSRTPVASAGAVQQRYLLTLTDEPRVILLLFVGGSGRLHLSEGLLETTSTNFLLRSRRLFAATSGGFAVAVPDAASDILTLHTGLRGLRRGQAHLSDIAAVIEDVRKKVTAGPRLPVCLVGTSRGAVSAAAYAATAQALIPGAPDIDCLVLTSPVTRPSRPPSESLEDVPLGHVTVPTLLVTDWHDVCRVSPPQGVTILEAALAGAPRVDKRIFVGGYPALSSGCRSLSPHGFFGIEPWVVKVIGNWIVDAVH